MSRFTKKWLFVLITIMAYFPMATAYAMPMIFIGQVTQNEAVEMTMTMDMSNCHHQQMAKKCAHCADQHHCNSAHSSCSASVGIALQSYELTVKQNSKPHYLTLRVSTLFQQTLPLFRPPISL